MKKSKLDTVYDYDFELIGLVSSVKSHKIAWEISSVLNTKLLREPNLVIHFNKKNTGSYTHFTAGNKLYEIRLFKNHPHDTEKKHPARCLVPEYAYLDYILMSQGVNRPDIDQTKLHLQHTLSIEMLIFIPLEKLKSKELFIF